ncbi:MAG: histidine kinase dimerization/phospho-acceptor domain-containing protein [Pseudomonadota bacterium]
MTFDKPPSEDFIATVRAVADREPGRALWVFAADGSRMMWANQAGLQALGMPGDFGLEAPVLPTPPAARSLRRLALAPTSAGTKGRIEILRLSVDKHSETIVATCTVAEIVGEPVILAFGSIKGAAKLNDRAPAAAVDMGSVPASGTIVQDEQQEQPTVQTEIRHDPAPPRSEPGFEFIERMRPHRFSMRVDAEGRASSVSQELAQAVGPESGGLAGQILTEHLKVWAVEQPDDLLDDMANGRSFSDASIAWKVQDNDLAVPVRMSGVFDDAGALQIFGSVVTADAKPVGASGSATLEAADAPEDQGSTPVPDEVDAQVSEQTGVPLEESTTSNGDESADTGVEEAVPSSELLAEPEPDPSPTPSSETPGPSPQQLGLAASAIGKGILAAIQAPGNQPIAPTVPSAEQDGEAGDGAEALEVSPIPGAGQDLTSDDLASDHPKSSEVESDTLQPEAPLTEEVSGGEGLGAEDPVSPPANAGAEGPHSVPKPDEDVALLSKPERLTFQEIARRLGARISNRADGDDAPETDLSDDTDANLLQPNSFGRRSSESAVESLDDVRSQTGGDTALGDSLADEPSPASDIMSADDPIDLEQESDDLLADIEEEEASGGGEKPSGSHLKIVRSDPIADEALSEVDAAIGPRPQEDGDARVIPFNRGSDSAPLSTERQILDRLPVALIVYADDKLLYANKAALELIGLQSLDALRAYSRIESLFEGGMAGRDGLMTLIRLDGTRLRVTGRLQSARWNDQPAALLSIQELRAGRSSAISLPSTSTPALPFDAASSSSAVGGNDPTSESLNILRVRIAELEAVVDLASDGVVTVDKTGEIKALNQAAKDLVGYADAELIGRPIRLLFAEDSRDVALDYLEDVATTGDLSPVSEGREVECLTAQGGLVPIYLTIGQLAEQGEGVYGAVLRDLTPFKRAEQDLVQARQAAEEANAHKSDFLARVSHEIRTPLNAVIGFSEVMLEERFGPVGSERYRQYLRDIHSSGEHLMSLLNDLLDLSKIEAGRMELSFTEVDLNEVVQQCLAMMQPQASQARIIVRTSLPLTVPKVVGDLRSLRQVVLNLVSNAIKFTEAGGQIIVSTLYEPSGEVSLRVRDTGQGMTAEDLALALEPFRQVPTTVNEILNGTGLGLPLTKALVEANKAALVLESTPGEGTLAKIAFPSQRVLAE